jgi:lysyl oxidase-like protein 2/3/4
MVAARDLSQHTRARVLLLEARDRIGGRTWTAKVAGEDIEMGGTWVHWNQPHVFSELQRYNLHRYLKSSAGTLNPEVQYYKGGNIDIQQLSPLEVVDICEKVAASLFEMDGMDSRMLMPYPHDPLREPMHWKKIDHISVGQRLDDLSSIPQFEREIFETMVNSIGSAPASETGLVEVLRWYALGGHSIAGMFELAGIHKLGKGGMTSLALAILGDFRGDVLLNSPVSDIIQDSIGVTVGTKTGKKIKAKAIISTVPL